MVHRLGFQSLASLVLPVQNAAQGPSATPQSYSAGVMAPATGTAVTVMASVGTTTTILASEGNNGLVNQAGSVGHSLSGSYEVSVLDTAGRVVLRATQDAGLSYGLDLSAIASGSYVVLVRGTNGGQMISLTKRLIKE